MSTPRTWPEGPTAAAKARLVAPLPQPMSRMASPAGGSDGGEEELGYPGGEGVEVGLAGDPGRAGDGVPVGRLVGIGVGGHRGLRVGGLVQRFSASPGAGKDAGENHLAFGRVPLHTPERGRPAREAGPRDCLGEDVMPRVSMTVNGRPVSGEVEGRTLLVEFLREGLRLTGTHVGCDTGQCGACVVHVDGVSVKACHDLRAGARGGGGGHDRGDGEPGRVARGDPGGVPDPPRAAVRLLHPGDGDERRRRC